MRDEENGVPWAEPVVYDYNGYDYYAQKITYTLGEIVEKNVHVK